ncbi:MAG: hypothetical protein ACI9JN_000231 [Bacteroidia bacterium]|jgi:hypothetical protein
MKIFEKYLPLKSLAFFPTLIGQSVNQIYSNTIIGDFDNNYFEAGSISVPLNMGFVCFRTIWTNDSEYEYNLLEVTKRDEPIGHDLFSITPSSKIKTIELYSEKLVQEWNIHGTELTTVKYDSAFLFRQDDGSSFLIGISEMSDVLVLFLRNEKEINDFLVGLDKRLEWQ